MTFQEITERIPELRKQIQYHRQKYYGDEPEITDAEFDTLYNQLKEWERQYPELITKDSPTQTVQLEIQSELKKEQHLVPMISLDNVYSKEELEEWENRWKKFWENNEEYIVEPKFDGLGISCIFENGTLVRAVTRGDGTEGENVTENAKTFLPSFHISKDIPVFEMRGEVLMKKSEFAKLNTTLQKENKKLFSNPRNAAAGSLRQLDPNITKTRNLSVFFYETPLLEQQKTFQTYAHVLKYFENNHIPHPPHYFVCQTIDEVYEKIEEIGKIRNELDFDIDGVVIKINSFEARNSIGATNHHPRWAVAYKFPAKQVSTKLEKVEWQVGRTGVLTPVAHLTPVEIDGVIVARATLHNADYIEEKDIQEGDEVLLERSGEVIPKILMPLMAKRNGTEKPIISPDVCPACGREVQRKEKEIAIKCVNPKCPEILKGKLEHFASKKCMNIEGLGESVAKSLGDQKIVQGCEDIFLLSMTDIMQIPGFQKKSAENLYNAIQKSRKNPLWRWIHAVSIPMIGEKTAKTLAQYYPNIEDLQNATPEELKTIPEIGEKGAEEIFQFFQNEENRKVFLFWQKEGSKENTSKILAEKTFLFTGTLHRLSRDQAEEKIEKLGGKILSAVSKNLSILVCGENAGSKKQKAQELGIEIWDEKTFLEKIGENTILEKEENIQTSLF